MKRVYTVGVFDLFHLGHLELLRKAKQCGDYLIVGIVMDEAVKKQKGKWRPIIPFAERYAIVENCKYVNEAQCVPIFHFPEHILNGGADVIVVGEDQHHFVNLDKIPQEKRVTLSRYEGTSTSSIIRKIEDDFSKRIKALEPIIERK